MFGNPPQVIAQVLFYTICDHLVQQLSLFFVNIILKFYGKWGQVASF